MNIVSIILKNRVLKSLGIGWNRIILSVALIYILEMYRTIKTPPVMKNRNINCGTLLLEY